MRQAGGHRHPRLTGAARLRQAPGVLRLRPAVRRTRRGERGHGHRQRRGTAKELRNALLAALRSGASGGRARVAATTTASRARRWRRVDAWRRRRNARRRREREQRAEELEAKRRRAADERDGASNGGGDGRRRRRRRLRVGPSGADAGRRSRRRIAPRSTRSSRNFPPISSRTSSPRTSPIFVTSAGASPSTFARGWTRAAGSSIGRWTRTSARTRVDGNDGDGDGSGDGDDEGEGGPSGDPMDLDRDDGDDGLGLARPSRPRAPAPPFQLKVRAFTGAARRGHISAALARIVQAADPNGAVASMGGATLQAALMARLATSSVASTTARRAAAARRRRRARRASGSPRSFDPTRASMASRAFPRDDRGRERRRGIARVPHRRAPRSRGARRGDSFLGACS